MLLCFGGPVTMILGLVGQYDLRAENIEVAGALFCMFCRGVLFCRHYERVF